MNPTGDIVQTGPGPVIIGFFTPDYRHLASTFAETQRTLGHAYHLFAVPKSEWKRAVLMKPGFLALARGLYPAQPLVLSDVDCHFTGSVLPIVTATVDVSLHQRCKLTKKTKNFRTTNRCTIWPSSRVVVVKPTRGANDLIASWYNCCLGQIESAEPYDDEIMLAMAISLSGGTSITVLPADYAAFEHDEAPETAVIVHRSAHDSTRIANRERRVFKMWRRKLKAVLFGQKAVGAT